MVVSLQSTTFSEHGGIPTYNRLVCRVLNETVSDDRNYVLIATDKKSDTEKASFEFQNLRLEAFDRDRLRLVWRFMRLALSDNCDLALLGHVNYAPLGWLLKKLRPRLRYGVMLYGVEAWQRLPWLKRCALQHADFLVSISDYTKQRAIEVNALEAERFYLLPNAVESASVEPVASQASEHTGNRLLSVCRLEKTEGYKGVDKVIDVLADVAKEVPDIQYTVVGGGTDLERHRQLALECGVAERVHFQGFLSEDALEACYRDCDVFVMPSAGEGFGFVFLEAMKHCKAIVAANSGGAPEVVVDEVTGRLVEYGNQEELVQALTELCMDAEKRARLGAAGYRRLQEKFTFAQFKEKLTRIISDELAAGVASMEHLPVGRSNPETP